MFRCYWDLHCLLQFRHINSLSRRCVYRPYLRRHLRQFNHRLHVHSVTLLVHNRHYVPILLRRFQTFVRYKIEQLAKHIVILYKCLQDALLIQTGNLSINHALLIPR